MTTYTDRDLLAEAEADAEYEIPERYDPYMAPFKEFCAAMDALEPKRLRLIKRLNRLTKMMEAE